MKAGRFVAVVGGVVALLVIPQAPGADVPSVPAASEASRDLQCELRDEQGSEHGGGLNACGCHFNRKLGTCHCHRDRGCGCTCQSSACP